MAYKFDELKSGIGDTKEWLTQELSTLRTGRATPALLDAVSIDVYGSRMKLNQVASISVEDARTLYVTPWDTEQVKPIEKAIAVADLGVTAGADERGVRVSFPELTTERREQLIKILKNKLEDARIAIKQKRTETMSAIDKSQKNNELSEDEAHDAKEEAQKLVDEGNKELEKIAEKKEAELKG